MLVDVRSIYCLRHLITEIRLGLRAVSAHLGEHEPTISTKPGVAM